MDNYLKKILAATFIIKTTTFLIIIAAFYLFPFCTNCHDSNFLYPRNQKITLVSAFKTWDGQHFLYLSDNWYSPNNLNNAFYPLYPLSIKSLKILFLSNTLITAIFLSNVFSLVAIILFYLLVRNLFNPKIAFLSSLFLLAFPTAFYLSLAYSESLFLMLVMIFVYSLYRKKIVPGLVAAILLPLARAQGVLLIIPLIVFLITESLKQKKKEPRLEFILPLALIAGLAAYFGIMYFSTGSALAAFNTYKYYLGNYTVIKIINPLYWFLRNFIFTNLTLHGFTTSMIDRTFFIILILILIKGWKLINKTLLSYTLVLALLPALADSFMAYTRYLLLAFPIFIILAINFRKNYILLLVVMFSWQLIFLVMHSLNYWVA